MEELVEIDHSSNLNKLKVAGYLGVVIVFLALSIGLYLQHSSANDYKSKLGVSQQKNVKLTKELKKVEKDYSAAQDTIVFCEAKLELAWRATARRNQVVADVFGDIFNDDVSGITRDNEQLYRDFVETEPCLYGVTYSDIFGG